MSPFRLTFPIRSHAPMTITARARRAHPRRRALPGALRAVALGAVGVIVVAAAAWAAWLLAGGDASPMTDVLPARSAGLLVASQSSSVAPVAGGAPLRAASWPADAQVLIDGQALGTTPLETAVLPGLHSVTLRRSGALDATRELNVPAMGAALDVALWRAQPTAVKLRPAYPGAAIADAQFLADGRIALIILLPTSAGAVSGQGALREAWLLDPVSGHLDAFSPSIRASALAFSPDGAHVAYLQQAPPPAPGQAGAGTPHIARRLDEVWIAAQDDRQPLRRVFQLPPPERGSSFDTPPVEQLADVAWAPDGRHLLIATRIGDGATVSRARLLVLDTEDPGGAPRELVTMPAEPVAGSYSWSADGSWVAFVARAVGAPAGKGLVTLVAAHLADDGAPGFRYLADLGHADSSAPPLPVTPVAWEPAAAEDGPAARLLYTAPVAAAAASGGLLDLGSLLSFRGPAEPPSGLFLTTPAEPELAPDDQRRVGSAVGLVGPVWLSPAVGPATGPVLALARTDDKGGQLTLRSVDFGSGSVRNTAGRLPASIGSRSALGVRWDAAHGQALLLARATTGSRGIATASTSPELDVWLVLFTEPREPGA